MGTMNMLAGQACARFLMASTSEVYGDPEVHPQVEELGQRQSYWNCSCYDEGKRIAETLTDYHRQNDVDICGSDLQHLWFSDVGKRWSRSQQLDSSGVEIFL